MDKEGTASIDAAARESEEQTGSQHFRVNKAEEVVWKEEAFKIKQEMLKIFSSLKVPCPLAASCG